MNLLGVGPLSSNPLQRLNQLRIAKMHKDKQSKREQQSAAQHTRGLAFLPEIAALEAELGVDPAISMKATLSPGMAKAAASPAITAAIQKKSAVAEISARFSGLFTKKKTLAAANQALAEAAERVAELEAKTAASAPAPQAAARATSPAVASSPAQLREMVAAAVAKVSTPAPAVTTTTQKPCLDFLKGSERAMIANEIASRGGLSAQSMKLYGLRRSQFMQTNGGKNPEEVYGFPAAASPALVIESASELKARVFREERAAKFAAPKGATL